VKGTELFAIKDQFIRVAAVGALGVVALAGFAAPASAVTAGVHASVAGTHVAAKGPNTDIEGSPAAFKPAKLSVKSVASGKCSSTNYSFSVSNDTKASQAVQEKTSAGKKKTLFTLKPKTAEGVCVSGSSGASGKLYLKSSGKALTVTIS
jgi:fatty acid/phospholipid biosynthesis enzyme